MASPLENMYNIPDQLIQDTEDWVEVTSVSMGEMYSWDDIYVFWSPTARRYYWYADGGCSCNFWGYNLDSIGDFCDGDRKAVERALREFSKDKSREAIVELNNFKQTGE